MKNIIYYIITSFISFAVKAQTLPVQWNTQRLFACPNAQPLPTMDSENVKAVLIDGPQYMGEATRFFAYYALPEGADAQHQVPAMVLIHGGGGSAFATWVREWVSRGFAAISLDTTGKIPMRLSGDPFSQTYANWALLPGGIHLDWGGFDRGFRSIDEQWPYCAVSEVILAHSFLRSIEGIDTTRIGITGNSWGGFLTLLSVAVDHRFKLAAPLYACGFYNQMNTTILQESFVQWCKLWDPCHYVQNIHIPLMWYGGATDTSFSFGCVDKTLSLFPSSRLYRVARPQISHTDGSAPEGRPAEVYAFAEQLLKQGKANYPQIKVERMEKYKAELRIQPNGCQIDRVEMYYTSDTDIPWANRRWQFQETDNIGRKETMKISVPKKARHCFFNIFTTDGLASSTQLIDCQQPFHTN